MAGVVTAAATTSPTAAARETKVRLFHMMFVLFSTMFIRNKADCPQMEIACLEAKSAPNRRAGCAVVTTHRAGADPDRCRPRLFRTRARRAALVAEAETSV